MRPARRRPLHRAAALLAVVGLSLAGLGATSAIPAVAAPQKAPASPGSSTSGDSLFPEVGNGGYNVLRYDISLSYARSGGIAATTTIIAKTTKRLSSFSLDLEKLAVSRVRVDGKAAAYTHVGNKLVITPARAIEGRFTVAIRYAGMPQPHIDPDGASEGWIPTADGATVVAEPVGAMTWFPNNNTPRDKATFRIAVTVPRDLEVAGSGDLASRKRRGATTTWTWVQTKPMATYLAMISIGQYDVYSSSMTSITGEKLPIWTFIEPKLGKLAEQRALIPKVIRFQERRFGRYPFTSAGIVVKDLDIDYALETQNRPVFDNEVGEPPETATIVHEFAHQWYGNSVTIRDWGDIWLNEGFANYAESWYLAGHGGPSTAKSFRDTYDLNPADSKLWSPAPADLTDPADLFADPVYTRGGLTLEALRQTVGSSDFKKIMKRWATDNRYATVTTGDFIALSERVSGEELSEFFDNWLYVPKRPALP